MNGPIDPFAVLATLHPRLAVWSVGLFFDYYLVERAPLRTIAGGDRLERVSGFEARQALEDFVKTGSVGGAALRNFLSWYPGVAARLPLLRDPELVAEVVREMDELGGRLTMVRIDRPMPSGESDPELFSRPPDPALFYQPEPVKPEEPHFVELEVVDQRQQPVGGIAYALTDPKEQTQQGKLGADAYYYSDPVPGGQYNFRVAEERGEEQPPTADVDLDALQEGWIELEILDEAERPLPQGLLFEVRLPDGTSRSGAVDPNGLVRLSDIAEGKCQFTFSEPNAQPDP